MRKRAAILPLRGAATVRNGRIEKALRIEAQVCHYPLVCRYIAVKSSGLGYKSSEGWTHNVIARHGETIGHVVSDGLAGHSER